MLTTVVGRTNSSRSFEIVMMSSYRKRQRKAVIDCSYRKKVDKVCYCELFIKQCCGLRCHDRSIMQLKIDCLLLPNLMFKMILDISAVLNCSSFIWSQILLQFCYERRFRGCCVVYTANHELAVVIATVTMLSECDRYWKVDINCISFFWNISLTITSSNIKNDFFFFRMI